MLFDLKRAAHRTPDRLRKRAVILTYQRTTFTDALRTAIRLKEHGAYEPVFFISAERAASLEQEIDECRRRGIPCVLEEEFLAGDGPLAFADAGRAGIGAESLRIARKIGDKLRERIGVAWAVWARVLGTRRYQRAAVALRRTALGRWAAKVQRKAVFRRLRQPGSNGFLETMLKAELRHRVTLTRLAADVVCLSEDIPGFHSGPFIRAAHRKGIPSVIIPFTIPNVLEIAEACIAKKVPWYLALDYRVAAVAYPRWSLMHKGRRLLRAHPGLIRASELRGMSPPNPWMTNSGRADRIAVESDRMLKVYRDAGFPEQQIVLTGSCADDFLHAALREKEARRSTLYRELKLPADRRLLLSSLVPDQLPSGVPECEFDNYGELVEFWVRTLAAWNDKLNVVLKINPRYRREEFVYLEKWGVKVAPHDTIDLVPLADIYVASISSTLRWAIACGTPSINYDVYHYRYGDFSDASGIVHVEKKPEFAREVARMVEDRAHWEELHRRQMSDARRWAALDGKSTERLVGLFDELYARRCTQLRQAPNT
jgi:hypothetical protein